MGRQLKCVLPAADVQANFDRRLARVGKKIRLDGFRPGKVPLSVVRERYGRSAFKDTVSDMIEDAYRQAISEHKLEPVGQPRIEDIKAEPGSDLEFSANIEVFPEFEPQLLAGIRIDKLVAEVTDTDINDMVMQLRRNEGEWKKVEREAAEGDRVKIEFVDERYAEAFNADDKKMITVMVGVSKLTGDLDTQLAGAKPSDTVKLEVKFPEDFREKKSADETESSKLAVFRNLLTYKGKLAGKTKRFKVVVHEVEECILPDLDQAFLEKYDIKEGGVEQLKKHLREGMEYQMKDKAARYFNTAVTNALIEKNPIDIPQTMIDEEIQSMRRQMAARFRVDEEKAKELSDELFVESATRDAHFFLIVNKISKSQEIQIDEQTYSAKLEEIIATYDDPEEARKYYAENDNLRAEVYMHLLQDEVIQHAAESADVNEKNCSFSEVMRLSNEQG